MLAKQIRNGLPVFSSDVQIGFQEGVLLGPRPPWPGITLCAIALNNPPARSLKNLRELFIAADNKAEGNPIGIRDSLLVAQFGYFNIAESGDVATYVKAWTVHPLHWPWPVAFFRDDNGALFGITPISSHGPAAP